MRARSLDLHLAAFTICVVLLLVTLIAAALASAIVAASRQSASLALGAPARQSAGAVSAGARTIAELDDEVELLSRRAELSSRGARDVVPDPPAISRPSLPPPAPRPDGGAPAIDPALLAQPSSVGVLMGLAPLMQPRVAVGTNEVPAFVREAEFWRAVAHAPLGPEYATFGELSPLLVPSAREWARESPLEAALGALLKAPATLDASTVALPREAVAETAVTASAPARAAAPAAAAVAAPAPANAPAKPKPIVPLQVPYRSQFDGSYYAGGNCGPASLAMAMAYFEEHWSVSGIRRSVSTYDGDWSRGAGASWAAMEAAAEARGFTVHGLWSGNGYRRWTLAELDEETRHGRPVILLVRLWSLPGQNDQPWWGDHYIVFLGFKANGDAVYHDPAWPDWEGARMVMSRERLIRAWTRTWSGAQYTAMSLRWPPAE